VGTNEQNIEFPVDFAAKGSGQSFGFVPKLWAARRIGELIDQLDLNGRNEELIKELVQLSTKHGIVTPYTSFIADESSTVRQLSDFSSNQLLTRRNLAALDETAGASGIGQRAAKQMYKGAENLAQSNPTFGAPGLEGAPSAGGGQQNAGGLPALVAGGGRPQEGQQGLRQIGNQTLYKRGKTLVAENCVEVDLEKEAANIVAVKRYSPEYFELVAANSVEENQLFAEQSPDEELVVKLRGKLYRVE
jgi:Ca-activated chloride channel family protein